MQSNLPLSSILRTTSRTYAKSSTKLLVWQGSHRPLQRSLRWLSQTRVFAVCSACAPARLCPLPDAYKISSKSVKKTRLYSSDAASNTSFSDPSRPELFYHLVEPPTPFSARVHAFALSFLPEPPSSADSSTVIGWLPALVEGEEQQAGLNDFKENPKFRALLHEAILSGLREGIDDIQINSAVQTQHGWMHIHDNRNIPALGRIGDPDDIIASVRVEDGAMLLDTYQAMPSYRICTADGLIQLTERLSRKLQSVLEDRAKTEKVH